MMDSIAGYTRPAPPTQLGPRPVNPSAFGTIEAAAAEADATARRVANLIDRLCGLAPTADSGDPNKRAEPNGILDAASRQAIAIRDSMSRIGAALDRLDTQLP